MRRPAPRRPFARLGEAAVAAVACAACTLLYLPSFALFWRDHLAPDPGDPLFNLYVLEWVGRQIRLGLPDLFGANFFYPAPHPLLLSDVLLGPAAQAVGLRALTGAGPVAAYNLLVFAAFALSGLTAAVVLRAVGLSRAGALVGGAVYAFAPYHWSQLSHLQVLAIQWIPLVLWLFDRLLATARPAVAAAFLAAYALHVTGGTYLAFMVHVPLLVLLLHRAAGEPGWRELLRPGRLRVLLPTAALAVGLAAAVFLPYALAEGALGPDWGVENHRIFGANLLALATPAKLGWQFPWAARWLPRWAPALRGDQWFAEKSFFLGLVPLALLLVAGLPRLRAVLARWRRREKLLLAAAAAVFLAADGVTLGLWPGSRGEVSLRLYAALGGAFVLLGGAALVLRRRAAPPEPPTDAATTAERGLLLAAGVSFLLCFPLLFAPLAALLPGFSGMRVPARFFPFALVGAALLCGRGAERVLAAAGRRRIGAVAAAALAVALLADLAPGPVPWHPVPLRAELPPVYAWLAAHDEVAALVELPHPARRPRGALHGRVDAALAADRQRLQRPRARHPPAAAAAVLRPGPRRPCARPAALLGGEPRGGAPRLGQALAAAGLPRLAGGGAARRGGGGGAGVAAPRRRRRGVRHPSAAARGAAGGPGLSPCPARPSGRRRRGPGRPARRPGAARC